MQSNMRRLAIANLPSLLLFFVVIPSLVVAYLLLPRAAFMSTISFLSLHGRSPQWQWGAALCASTIARGWGKAKVIGGGAEKQQTCFVITPAAWTPLLDSWSWEFIAWAIVRHHVAATLDRNLCIVSALPPICNAPVLRLLFQALGFHDYRSSSVKVLLDRGFSLLFFDQQLADLQLRKASAPLACVSFTVEL